MICFRTPGLIDLNAVTTMGVNAKIGNNPIGYFGTGLKYAIAIILRNGGSFVMYRGKRKYVFKAKKRTVRGKPFNIVFMNDQKLGFTTDLGKNWEPWMAFRELHSNTLDENGFTRGGRATPEAGWTTIMVDNFNEFDMAFQNAHEYFITTSPLFVSAGVEVHIGGTNKVYYRGIYVGQTRKPNKYTYNFTYGIELTEDRTVRYDFQVTGKIIDAIVKAVRPEFIDDVITADDKEFNEPNLDFTDAGTDPSKEFLDKIEQLTEGKRGKEVPDSIKRLVMSHRPTTGGIKPLERTPEQDAMIEQAYEVCELAGYKDVRDIPLHIISNVPGESADVFATATDDEIYLSIRCFQIGLKTVVEAIAEEYMHITLGFYDESRSFQNYLMERLIQYMVKDYERSQDVS